MIRNVTIAIIILSIGGFMAYRHFNIADRFTLTAEANMTLDNAPTFSENVETEDPILEKIRSGEFYFDNSGNLVHFNPKYVPTPDSVRAVYMTSWVAGRKDLRKNIHEQIRNNESINAIVIDIKDDTGKISFTINHPLIQELGSSENRIPDMREFIAELHEDGIYVIGRVAVFQDPYLITKWPDEAVKKKSAPEENWVDRKNIGWMDASSEKVWDYVNIIAEESHKIGFDEINFDYIRFPSDGNMADMKLVLSDGKNKADVLESFFKYTHDRLSPQNITISADIFGMTAVNTDDLGIGQILERTMPYFDYVSPMVYPSHFPKGWAGIENPAADPYLVIKKSMGKAVERVVAMGEDPQKLRPWLQDFNMGATYTHELVQAQIQATYDVGLDSWLMWDPRNTYTISAFTTPQ